MPSTRALPPSQPYQKRLGSGQPAAPACAVGAFRTSGRHQRRAPILDRPAQCASVEQDGRKRNTLSMMNEEGASAGARLTVDGPVASLRFAPFRKRGRGALSAPSSDFSFSLLLLLASLLRCWNA